MCAREHSSFFFFFNDTATTEIYTLSLHDALPIFRIILLVSVFAHIWAAIEVTRASWRARPVGYRRLEPVETTYAARDRKSTRLNSSHGYISYAVFCLKKKKHSHVTSARSFP